MDRIQKIIGWHFYNESEFIAEAYLAEERFRIDDPISFLDRLANEVVADLGAAYAATLKGAWIQIGPYREEMDWSQQSAAFTQDFVAIADLLVKKVGDAIERGRTSMLIAMLERQATPLDDPLVPGIVLDDESVIAARAVLLEAHIQRTGNTEYAIYTHGPKKKLHTRYHSEFIKYKKGELPSESATTISLETFLKSDIKIPISSKNREAPLLPDRTSFYWVEICSLQY